MLRLIPIDVPAAFLRDVASINARGYCMNDDHARINEAIAEGWVGETGLRQVVRRLVRDTREDERAACEALAEQNESRKTAEAIRARGSES